MALSMKKVMAMNGSCVIDGETVETYSVNISTENPEEIRFARTILNQALRKANHESCIQSQIEFEREAYEEQDRMIMESAE